MGRTSIIDTEGRMAEYTIVAQRHGVAIYGASFVLAAVGFPARFIPQLDWERKALRRRPLVIAPKKKRAARKKAIDA